MIAMHGQKMILISIITILERTVQKNVYIKIKSANIGMKQYVMNVLQF